MTSSISAVVAVVELAGVEVAVVEETDVEEIDVETLEPLEVVTVVEVVEAAVSVATGVSVESTGSGDASPAAGAVDWSAELSAGGKPWKSTAWSIETRVPSIESCSTLVSVSVPSIL